MAMSFIWTGFILISVLFSLVNGCTQAVSAAALEGAAAGIQLSVSLAGVLCLWSGLVKVMEYAGLSRMLSKLLSPLLHRLYPIASKDEQALRSISANISANLLGLGNAATPLGIEAVGRMKALNRSDEASDEMCRFVVMNTASIQLIPSTVAAVRAGAGAVAPFDILPSVWTTSLCAVSVGLAATYLFRRIWPHDA